MRRFELTYEPYALLQPLLPPAKKTGRPLADDRKILNDLFRKLATGASWRDIPNTTFPGKRSTNAPPSGVTTAPWPQWSQHYRSNSTSQGSSTGCN